MQFPANVRVSNPKNLKKYLCIRRFDAQSDSEMSIKIGQVVELVFKDKSGWWLVYSYDRKGYVPGSYLISMDSCDRMPSVQDGRRGPTAQARKQSDTLSSCTMYVTIKSYTAKRTDEITLSDGTHVEVLKANDDGWWTVRVVKNPGQTGKFPAVFLKSIVDNDQPKQTPNCKQSVAPRRDRRLALYNLTKGALKRYSHSTDATSPARIADNAFTTNTVEHTANWYATDDYDDTYGDSISFSKGDPITVLHKTSTGWWHVCIKGVEGWAPAAYLSTRRHEQTKKVQPKPSVVQRMSPQCPLLEVPDATADTGHERRHSYKQQPPRLPRRNKTRSPPTSSARVTESHTPVASERREAKKPHQRISKVIQSRHDRLVDATLQNFTASMMDELKQNRLFLINRTSPQEPKKTWGDTKAGIGNYSGVNHMTVL